MLHRMIPAALLALGLGVTAAADETKTIEIDQDLPTDLVVYDLDAEQVTMQEHLGEQATVVYMLDDDHLYVACGATLWAVSARDGSRVWERRFEAPLGPPVAAEGRLYVTSEDGHAFALLPSSGADRWRFERAGVTFATPAPHGRLVYLAGSDGVLYAIRD